MKQKDLLWLIVLALSFAAVALFRGAINDPVHGVIVPGVGITVSQWVLAAAVLGIAGRTGKLKWNRSGVFLLAVACLLGGVCVVYANVWMLFFNGPLTLLLTVQALFSLTGTNERDGLSGKGLWEGLRRFFASLFCHVSMPFRCLSQAFRQEEHKGLGLGIAIALPVLAVVTILLCGADSVFDGLLSGAALGISFTAIFDLLWTITLSLVLFSLLYAALAQPRKLAEPKQVNAAPVTFLVVLGALAVIYAVFGYIQVRYLFMGEEAVQMQNGYAEYARSGFFRLVWVALITLGVELPALSVCRESRTVRVFCAAVAALTLLIDVSAFLRLLLYIRAYGLTLLRVLTLWAIVMICGTLIVTLIRCAVPKVRICPAVAVMMLSAWVLLNYANVDLRIAQYNVNAFNEKRLIKLDTVYLIDELSPDVYPALEKIADEAERKDALQMFAEKYQTRTDLYHWSLSTRYVNGK